MLHIKTKLVYLFQSTKARELSPEARSLFAMLISHADDHGHAWPGQERQADLMGVSDRQVRNLLAELKSHQLIRVFKRGKFNVYDLTPALSFIPGRPADQEETPEMDLIQPAVIHTQEVPFPVTPAAIPAASAETPETLEAAFPPKGIKKVFELQEIKKDDDDKRAPEQNVITLEEIQNRKWKKRMDAMIRVGSKYAADLVTGGEAMQNILERVEERGITVHDWDAFLETAFPAELARLNRKYMDMGVPVESAYYRGQANKDDERGDATRRTSSARSERFREDRSGLSL